MDFVDNIIQKNPEIQKKYDEYYQEAVEVYSDPVNSDNIDFGYIDMSEEDNSRGNAEPLPLAAKYANFTFTIADLFKDHETNKKLLKKIFEEIEDFAKGNPEKEEEITILFIESLVNILLAKDKYDLLYSYFGPITRSMCEKNNEFWREIERMKDQNKL